MSSTLAPHAGRRHGVAVSRPRPASATDTLRLVADHFRERLAQRRLRLSARAAELHDVPIGGCFLLLHDELLY